MRVLLLIALIALAGCGGGQPATGGGIRAPSPRASSAPPHVLTRNEMLAALPADTTILVALDIPKLRQSPLAKRAWDFVRSNERAAGLLDALCGTEDKISYALASMNFEKHALWMWVRGLDRGAKADCAKARDLSAQHQQKRMKHGPYELSTSDKSVAESLWFDEQTSLMVIQGPDTKPIGEQALRDTVASGRGLTSTTSVGAMLEHVDFASGAVFATDAGFAKLPGVLGLAASVEVDDGARAQVYIRFDSEDRASELHAKYRPLLDKALQAHRIDSADLRLDGAGIAASVALTAAQLDSLMQIVAAKKAELNASPTTAP